MQIQRVLPSKKSAIVEGTTISCHPKCHSLARTLGSTIFKSNVLSDEVLPLNNYGPAPKRPRPNHSRRLMVFDFGGGVVPGENRGFWRNPGECYKVLRLRNVDRLSVDARRDSDHRPARVSERHDVYGFLDGVVIGGGILGQDYIVITTDCKAVMEDSYLS